MCFSFKSCKPQRKLFLSQEVLPWKNPFHLFFMKEKNNSNTNIDSYNRKTSALLSAFQYHIPLITTLLIFSQLSTAVTCSTVHIRQRFKSQLCPHCAAFTSPQNRPQNAPSSAQTAAGRLLQPITWRTQPSARSASPDAGSILKGQRRNAKRLEIHVTLQK